MKRLTLTGLKRVHKTADAALLGRGDRRCWIFSGQWGLYWAANRCGYQEMRLLENQYSFESALRATWHCGPEKRIEFEFLRKVRAAKGQPPA